MPLQYVEHRILSANVKIYNLKKDFQKKKKYKPLYKKNCIVLASDGEQKTTKRWLEHNLLQPFFIVFFEARSSP